MSIRSAYRLVIQITMKSPIGGAFLLKSAEERERFRPAFLCDRVFACPVSALRAAALGVDKFGAGAVGPN